MRSTLSSAGYDKSTTIMQLEAVLHAMEAKKGGGRKERRQRDQKKRLVALGMDEGVVAKMSARDVLTKLKYPAKVAKEFGGE